MYFTLLVSILSKTLIFFDDCCLWKTNIFSIVKTSHTVTVSHRIQHCTPSTVVTVYKPCCMISSSNIWTYLWHMCANQTVHEEVVRMCSWTTLSAQKIPSTFARHVASPRAVPIENTLKCPCLNMSSRGTPQISPRTCRLFLGALWTCQCSNPSRAPKSSYGEWLIMKLCMYVVCICGMERYIINCTS